MNNFEIINETGIEIAELKFVNSVIKKAIQIEKLENAEFNIIIVNNEYIKELNKNYRNIDSYTDVISFALEDYKDIALDIRMLGDIYISYDKAVSQAKEYSHSLKRELCFLAVHGFLHLLGYDHMDSNEEEKMFERQELILNEANCKK